MNIDISFMWDALRQIAAYIPVTLELTLGGLLIALPFAILFAFAAYRKVPVLYQISKVFISFVRGTPIILHMFVLYNLLPELLNWYLKAIGSDFKIWDVDPKWYAFIALSLYPLASLTECFRSALATVDKGQMEAAETVGLTRLQGYLRIVIPQAVVSAMPLMCNVVIDVLKSTSLAFSMMVVEITGEAKILAGLSMAYVEAYLDIFIIYIILVIVIENIFKLVERRISRYKVA